MSQIFEYISIAIMNIRENKGRSVLTMLGIIIGISSVILVISIGNGVRGEINNTLDGIAGGQVVVYVDMTRKDTNVSFDESDVEALSTQIDHVKGASPSFGLWGTAEAPKKSQDLRLMGGTPSYLYNSTEPIVKGRYYNQNDLEASSPVCIIRESQAREMFGTTDVVGMSFDATVWGTTKELKIIGIRQDSPSALMSMLTGSGFVEAEVPYTFMVEHYGMYPEISEIYLYSEKSEYSSEVAKSAVVLLESRHHCKGENQVLVESFSDYSAQYNSILSAITLFVSLVAAISLLVGGIGVMNIMLVSVTERTREIGIRKSLGATTKSIMWQFLAEAGIITLLGGIIGIVIGVLGAKLICTIISMKASISLGVVLGASIFSCGVGIFFGIYPAKKAASLSPIEALRHE